MDWVRWILGGMVRAWVWEAQILMDWVYWILGGIAVVCVIAFVAVFLVAWFEPRALGGGRRDQ